MTDSSAPNPETVAAGEPSETPRHAPWRGRKRSANPRDKVLRIRCTTPELEQLKARAQTSGLSLGAYIRATVLGSAGPRAVKRPNVEREQLTRLLGEMGKIGSNWNQLAKWSNTEKSPASLSELARIRADLVVMREAVMKALDRGD